MATDDTRKNNNEQSSLLQQAHAKHEQSIIAQATKQKEANTSLAELLQEQDREREAQQVSANEHNTALDLERLAAEAAQLQAAEKNKEPEEAPKKDDRPSSCRYKKPQDITKAKQDIENNINQILNAAPELFTKKDQANFLTMKFFDDHVVAVMHGIRMALKNNDDGIGSTFSFASNDNNNMIQKSIAAGAMHATLIHTTTDASKGFNFQASQDIATLRASPKDRADLSTYSAVIASNQLGMDISLNGNKLDHKQVKEIQKDLTFTVQKESSLAELLAKGRSGLKPVSRPTAKTPEPYEPAATPSVAKTNANILPSSPVVVKAKEHLDPTLLVKDAEKLKAEAVRTDKADNTTTRSMK